MVFSTSQDRQCIQLHCTGSLSKMKQNIDNDKLVGLFFGIGKKEWLKTDATHFAKFVLESSKYIKAKAGKKIRRSMSCLWYNDKSQSQDRFTDSILPCW
jgi:hypothetical protein